MAKKRILVLGAGLGGLSAAWHLQKKGRDCRVFEKEPEVGGLCRSKKIGGFTFDCDGHLLHFRRHYCFNLVKHLLEDNLIPHQRSAWIYAHGKYIQYPFQANLYGLPLKLAQECLLGFIETLNNGKLKKKKKLNFLEWINQNFGKGIARHFMVPYNSKFWTLPPQELTCEWLDGFIPVPSLGQVIEGAISESQRQFGYNAQFWYPKKGGISQLPLALANRIKNIYTDCQIVKIDLQKKEIKMASGNKEKFDFLLSTLPLPEMQHLIKRMPVSIHSLFKNLKWNSIFNLNLGIEKKDASARHWIYFAQRNICFFRVGFFHNFSPYLSPPDKGSLYIEVAYSPKKPVDKTNIISRIKGDLKRIGILGPADMICTEDINDIKYGYPIYDENYHQTREKILKYLLQNNILPCGRYGSWRYMSMEDVVLEGKEISDKLC